MPENISNVKTESVEISETLIEKYERIGLMVKPGSATQVLDVESTLTRT